MFVHLRDHIRGSIKVAFDIFQGSQQGLYLLISFSLKEYQCDYTKELSTGRPSHLPLWPCCAPHLHNQSQWKASCQNSQFFWNLINLLFDNKVSPPFTYFNSRVIVVTSISMKCSTPFLIRISMEVKMSTRLLHSWPTLQADFARLASFSTETLGGNTGNLGRSNCWGNWTLLSSLL